MERAAHLVLFVLCLFVSLVVSHFGFDGKTVFLIHQFLVIAYLLLYYHVGNHIALSEHPYVKCDVSHSFIWDLLKRCERHLR